MFALGVGAAHPGKSLNQVSTSQVLLDHLLHHRPKEPVLFLAMFVIAGLEVFIVVVQYLPPSAELQRTPVWRVTARFAVSPFGRQGVGPSARIRKIGE